jgi:hypothetical protein
LQAASSGAAFFANLVPRNEEKETKRVRQRDPFDALAEMLHADWRQRVLIKEQPGEQQNVPRHRLGEISLHDHQMSE